MNRLNLTVMMTLLCATSVLPAMASELHEGLGGPKTSAGKASSVVSAVEEAKLEADIAALTGKLRGQGIQTPGTGHEAMMMSNRLIRDNLRELKKDVAAFKPQFEYQGKNEQMKFYSKFIRMELNNIDTAATKYLAFLDKNPAGSGKSYADELGTYQKNLGDYLKLYNQAAEKEGLEEDWVMVE